MREKKVGIFTLAITLILLGALFLLNNFMDIKIYSILSIFWPSILIILGLEIVLSKVIFGKDEDKTKLSISGKSIFFTLLIVLMAFILSQFYRMPLEINIDGGFIPQILYKSETVANKDITIETKNKNKLKIINSFGSVNVKKGEEKDIKVNMLVSFKHNYDDEAAQNIVDNILEVINDGGDDIRLINRREKYTANNSINNLEVNLDITVPYDMELDITNSHGDIMLNNCSNRLVISNKHGNILVNTLKGDLNIKNSYGEIEVVDIEGKAIIENRHGKLSAKKISKDIDITNEYGDVKVSEIGGNADINNLHEGIEAEKIGGSLVIESKYCRMDISEVKGDMKVNGSHGNIDAENIDGDVRIDNEYGGVKLSQANKSIEIKNKNDAIIFESDKVISKELKVENEHGRIDIRLPKDQEGKFDVYTRHGRINNDFGLNINRNNSEESIEASIGNKEVIINIRAENGDIRIDN